MKAQIGDTVKLKNVEEVATIWRGYVGIAVAPGEAVPDNGEQDYACILFEKTPMAMTNLKFFLHDSFYDIINMIESEDG